MYRSLQKDGDYKKINNQLISLENSGSYSYIDSQILTGLRYYYKLEDVSIHGVKTIHGPILAELSIPNSFSLEQNYPNPFNPETTVKFQLPKQVHVFIGIYNVLGQEVRTLIDKKISAGYHSIKWDGKNNDGDRVTSGIYYYRIKADTFTSLKKMLLMK